MKRILVVVAGGMVVLAIVMTLAVPTETLAQDGSGSGARMGGSAQQDIVIQLPLEHRIRESVRNDGHQPWRSDPKMAAMGELRHFIREVSGDVTAEAGKGCRIVRSGTDDYGRSTVVIEKDIESSVWLFEHPVARIHMFKNAGGVWITTRIVIKQQRNR